jgi:hypothetical protein
MDAGPALDRLIAERVLGKAVSLCDGTGHSGSESCGEYGHVVTYTEDGISRSWWAHMPPYSTAISSAWRVVARMADLGWWVDIDSSPVTDDTATGPWAVCFVVQRTDTIGSGGAHHAPLAICRAALAALDALGA